MVFESLSLLFDLFIHTPIASFPSCVMEFSSDEVKEWLSPKDFGIGKTVNVMGRKFLV